MNIKLTSPIAIMAFVFAVAMTACSPYEEGPGLSLRSKASRIANTWQVNYAVEADGDDRTARDERGRPVEGGQVRPIDQCTEPSILPDRAEQGEQREPEREVQDDPDDRGGDR